VPVDPGSETLSSYRQFQPLDRDLRAKACCNSAITTVRCASPSATWPASGLSKRAGSRARAAWPDCESCRF